ncbi:murein L,D-transpeptidase catalytic domain-containing protein [Rhizobium sp. L1K21]|uniref:murein L,D-transpeptidase catalytic domain-containing protein n=1 Tax=Rhizobium sp. L1K21 TaxID=2954933 RepID=UPI0020928A3A|nr:murein L,D-transpeptidase catalytic domain family protein [Rhizobium sp. L1K21]MCO6188334.1 murein L,D-transpeptidase catalytic domain family protein [Rhizobium sp. L1K21]
MKLTAGERLVCDRVINVFETGTVKGKYGAISIYKDGPGGIRQITYGRSQTTEYGNLRQLVEMYAAAEGTYSDDFKPYVKLIGHVALVDNEPFKSLLRQAGKDDPVMWATQDKFFDSVYFAPAQKWATANGFELPLSMLVIYDSFIHSGRILDFLRSRFPEKPPVHGGDEKIWIKQYVEVRHDWLKNHKNEVLRLTIYRTKDLLREISRDNWDLKNMPVLANGTPVDDTPEKRPSVPAIPKASLQDLVPFLGDIDEADMVSDKTATETIADHFTATASSSSVQQRETVLRSLAASAGVTPAMERLINYRNQYRPTSNPRYWAVVNFDLHSAKPRMFLFDCVAGTTTALLCAHGRGSEGPKDDGYAEFFSNEDGSGCSSLGIYHCDVTYFGNHGKSLYLDGLEATNSRARLRHIVIHGADYVSPEMVAKTGRIGRSLGCPAVEEGEASKVVEALAGGSLMIIWKS